MVTTKDLIVHLVLTNNQTMVERGEFDFEHYFEVKTIAD